MHLTLDHKIRLTKSKSYPLLHPTKVKLDAVTGFIVTFNVNFVGFAGKAIAAASKAQHQRSRPQVSIYSSDDDAPQPAKNQTAPKRVQNDTKKKPVLPNKSKANAVVPLVTGGKAPPAVVKQQQQQLQSLNNKNLVNKSGAAAKVTQKASTNSKTVDSKEKSIFSPDNTTESEEDVKTKTSKPPATKTKPPPRPKGRPPKPKVVEKPVVKSSAESSTTASTSDSTSTR